MKNRIIPSRSARNSGFNSRKALDRTLEVLRDSPISVVAKDPRILTRALVFPSLILQGFYGRVNGANLTPKADFASYDFVPEVGRALTGDNLLIGDAFFKWEELGIYLTLDHDSYHQRNEGTHHLRTRAPTGSLSSGGKPRMMSYDFNLVIPTKKIRGIEDLGL